MNSPEITIVGAGVSGLAAACTLAHKGCRVTVLEKNPYAGGRISAIHTDNGFVFEKGISRMWLPDIIKSFFKGFGQSYEDYFKMISAQPVTRYFFGNTTLDIPNDEKQLYELFSTKKNSKDQIETFFNTPKEKYNYIINNLNDLNIQDISSIYYIQNILSKSYSSRISKYKFTSELTKILEYSIFSSGGNPFKADASFFTNYADLIINTQYPKYGLQSIIHALEKLAYSFGVQILYNAEVEYFDVIEKKVAAAVIKHNNFYSNYFISSADYCYTESNLLPKKYRNLNEKKRNKIRYSPSSLLFFIGLSKKVPQLKHSNVILDSDLHKHIHETFDLHIWPENPVFSVKVNSKIYKNVAPEGCENIVINIPVAFNLEDNGKIRETYFAKTISRLENLLSTQLINYITYKKSYAQSDFIHDYNSTKGNVYGIENSLFSSKKKLSCINNRLTNFYYAGHYTAPGPGISFSLLSGVNAAKHILQREGLIG